MIPPTTSHTRGPVGAMPRADARGDDIEREREREDDALDDRDTVAGGLGDLVCFR